MYFLTFHGIPTKKAIDTEGIGGAYINCYMLESDIVKATKIARRFIANMKWRILAREEAYEVDEKSISRGGRKYYNQALIDKAVYVIHTYPTKDKSKE
jgi:hypothetical protein